MKLSKLAILCAVLLLTLGVHSYAGEKLASEEDIANLKGALISGKIEVGKTRMKEILELYGAPNDINDKEKTAVYNYGDMKIEFDKIRYMRDWEYDSFKKPAYTTDINNLRRDLESDKLPGELTTFDKIKKDYKAPTSSKLSEKDAELTVYYYGDIKLIFENHFVVKSWKGKKLEPVTLKTQAALGSSKKEAEMKKDTKEMKK